MRIKMVLMSMFLCLSFGCASDESRPLPEETPAEELGQVEQAIGGPCRVDCNCPLGESCDFTKPHPLGNGNSWTCMPFPVFGPSAHPCLDTCQCQHQFNWFSSCNRPPWASYGECVPQ